MEEWEAGARRLGVPSGLSEAILQPVNGAARMTPPWLCGDLGHWVPGDEGEDGSGKLGQPAWGQKEEGGAPGEVTLRAGKRVSRGPQGPFTRLQASWPPLAAARAGLGERVGSSTQASLRCP